MNWNRGKIALTLPCYRFEDYLIWGLTLRMLDEMVAILQKKPSNNE
jgi:hypothetical protein